MEWFFFQFTVSHVYIPWQRTFLHCLSHQKKEGNKDEEIWWKENDNEWRKKGETRRVNQIRNNIFIPHCSRKHGSKYGHSVPMLSIPPSPQSNKWRKNSIWATQETIISLRPHIRPLVFKVLIAKYYWPIKVEKVPYGTDRKFHTCMLYTKC